MNRPVQQEQPLQPLATLGIAALPIQPAAANRPRPHPRLLAVRQLDRTERHGRIGERHRQRHVAAAHSAAEPRRMQDAAIDRMRRDVVLPRHIEPPFRIGNDLLMNVAVRAADMDVRAGIVRHQRRIVATPHPGEILWRLHPRRIARTEHRGRRRESQRYSGEHRVSLPIYPPPTSFGHMATLRSLFFLVCLGLTPASAQQRPPPPPPPPPPLRPPPRPGGLRPARPPPPPPPPPRPLRRLPPALPRPPARPTPPPDPAPPPPPHVP